MNPMKRPPQSEAWSKTDGATERARLAIKALLDRDGIPSAEDFENTWSHYAARFEKAQHQLCGYCTQKLTTSPGDLDHFRPKTAYTRIIKAPGAEQPGTIRVQGRKLQPEGGLKPAWPELAYLWDNYVYACERCNRAWKQTLFPALDVRTNKRIEGKRQKGEQPMLLSPFELDEPAEHFRFNKQGAIRGVSCRGQETIAVCGLDRPSLTLDRRNTFESALHLLDGLRRAGLPESIHITWLRAVIKLGQWNQPYAAMWRDLVLHDYGYGHWGGLRTRAALIGVNLDGLPD